MPQVAVTARAAHLGASHEQLVIFSLEDVLQLLRQEPQLADMNRHLIEAYWQRLQQRTLMAPESNTLQGTITCK